MSQRAREPYIHEIRLVPELGPVIDELEDIAELLKHIRAVFGTDDPAAIAGRIGETVGGTVVTQETVVHATELQRTHAALTERFNAILAELRHKIGR